MTPVNSGGGERLQQAGAVREVDHQPDHALGERREQAPGELLDPCLVDPVSIDGHRSFPPLRSRLRACGSPSDVPGSRRSRFYGAMSLPGRLLHGGLTKPHLRRFGPGHRVLRRRPRRR